MISFCVKIHFTARFNQTQDMFSAVTIVWGRCKQYDNASICCVTMLSALNGGNSGS